MKLLPAILKQLRQSKCNWHLSTLIAISAGLGSAVGCGLLAWYFLLLPLPVLYMLNRKQLLITAGVLLSALLSGIINYHISQAAADKIPHQKAVISGKVTCTDTRTAKSKFLTPPAIVTCRVDTPDASFDAAVICPENINMFYGDCYRFSGKIHPAQNAGLICRDNQISGEYPPLFGKRPLLIINEMSPEETPFSIMRIFLDCRNILLSRLLERIRNPVYAEMAARLFLGAGSNSNIPMKNFAASGTIHLFSVSGLHVTLLAGIFLLLFRPMPFRWRYALAAIITLFYVLCSGASLPAIRAGAMVIVWCIMRSMLLPSSGWDSMMLTWSFCTFLDPETTGSLSAQYSFGITAALLLMLDRFNDHFARQQHILSLMPPQAPLTRERRKLFRHQRNLAMIPAVSVTAFISGAGIALYRQNIFTPASIPANLILTMLTPLLFGAMIFKMFFGAFAVIFDEFGAMLLEGSFCILDNFTREIARIFPMQYIQTPPLWSVVLFYLCLFGTLGFSSAIKRKWCLLGTALIIFNWYLFLRSDDFSLLVISSSSDRPALLALIYPGGDVEAVDIPDKESGALAAGLLREKGVKSLRVNFSGTAARNISGLPALSRQLECSVTAPLSKRKPTKAFMRHLRNAGFTLPEIPSPAKLTTPAPDSLIWEIPHAKIEISSSVTDCGRSIEITGRSGKTYKQILPWCSRPVVWQCEIK